MKKIDHETSQRMQGLLSWKTTATGSRYLSTDKSETKTEHPSTRHLTPDELHELLAVLTPHQALWVLLAVYTGGREAEINNMRWDHVHWDDKPQRIRFPDTKTMTATRWRFVPLHPILAEALSKERKTTGVIIGEWRYASHDLAVACKRAGIATVSPKDLRRTCIYWHKQAGVDNATIAHWLGSSTRLVDCVSEQIDGGTNKAIEPSTKIHPAIDRAIRFLAGLALQDQPVSVQREREHIVREATKVLKKNK